MHEHLQVFFDIHNALPFSGPAYLTPDHGVSQLLARCIHPTQIEANGQLFSTLLLPFVIILQGEARLCDVCYIRYNAHEEDNSSGPGRQLGRDGFNTVCTHSRIYYNARFSPLETEIKETTKSMAARIFLYVMDGDGSSRYAAGVFNQAGIRVILDDN